MAIYIQNLLESPKPLIQEVLGGKAFGFYKWQKFIQQNSSVLIPPSYYISSFQVLTWLQQIPDFQKLINEWAEWPSSAETVPNRLRHFQEKILFLQIPDDFHGNMIELRRHFNSDQVIFRSSFSIEDQSTDSMSGCFESVVSSWKIEECWKSVTVVLASSFSVSSMTRILQSGVDPRKMSWSILLQPYLKPILSGTATTCDPQNPFSKKAFVEFSKQAPDAVTSGESFETQIASEGQKLCFNLDSILWQFLSRLRELEKQPQEIEWLWNDQGLWILQVRPIASEISRLVGGTADLQVWSRAQTAERFPEALTTMGWSAIQGTFQNNLDILHRRFGIEARNSAEAGIIFRGYVYADSQFFSLKNLKIKWSKFFHPLKIKTWTLLAQLIKDAILRKPRSVMLLRFLTNLLNEEILAIQSRWKTHQIENLKKWNNLRIRIDSDNIDLLELMEEQQSISNQFLEDDLAVFMIKELILNILQNLWLSNGLNQSDLLKVIGPLQYNKTSLMNEELRILLCSLSEDSGLEIFFSSLERCMKEEDLSSALNHLEKPKNRVLFQKFFENNGHMNTTWDISKPCWREEPRLLIPFLVAIKEKRFTPKKIDESSSSKKIPILNSDDQIIIDRSLQILKSMMEIDEDQHFQTGFLMYTSRLILLKMEKKLIEKGVLSQVGDIFHLTLAEVKEALKGNLLSLKHRILKRSSNYERNLSWFPPQVLGQTLVPQSQLDLQLPLQTHEFQSHFLGQPMSPGRAQGRVFFLNHLHEFQMTSSDPMVLLTRSPNPALTPLFPLIAALVTETGGPLSHGFVAAREYGLPAISIANFSLINLKSGDWVEVDGDSGEFKKL